MRFDNSFFIQQGENLLNNNNISDINRYDELTLIGYGQPVYITIDQKIAIGVFVNIIVIPRGNKISLDEVTEILNKLSLAELEKMSQYKPDFQVVTFNISIGGKEKYSVIIHRKPKACLSLVPKEFRTKLLNYKNNSNDQEPNDPKKRSQSQI